MARSLYVLVPDHAAATSSGTSSRPMAMASCRWRERDQKDRITKCGVSAPCLSDQYGVIHTGLREAGRAKCATVAAAARAAVRIRVITTVRQAVIEIQLEPSADDLRLREVLQVGVDAKPAAVHPFRRRQRRQPFEGPDVLGTAIGI